MPAEGSREPLAEDWDWVRGHMTALLQLAQEFGQKFAERKRADGVLDFHDLEQFALKLLWDSASRQTDRHRRTLAAENPIRLRGRISGHQRRPGQNHPGVEPRRTVEFATSGEPQSRPSLNRRTAREDARHRQIVSSSAT